MSDLSKCIAELSPQKRELLMQQLNKNKQNVAQNQIQRQSRDSHVFPLSFAQQRLWFLDQLEPGNSSYNIPAIVRVEGQLNASALEQSLNAIIQRHEVLRTYFATINDQSVQIIAPKLKLTLPVINLRELSETEREQAVQQLATQEAQQPFDLRQAPLLRVSLLHLSESDYVVLFTMHHIISDGWSMGVLIQEIATFYPKISNNQPFLIPDLPIQYADFAVWQRQWLAKEVLENQTNYWKKQLGGSLPILDLPTDKPRPAVQTFKGGQQTFVFPKKLSEQLTQLGKQQEATLFMVLLAAFKTLLYRYTGQEDILVGSPIANRNRAEIEELIGFFVNTLVLRTQLNVTLSFRQLLKRIRDVALGAYAHQDLPFEKLVEELQPERNLSHTPLFQVMFDFQNEPTRKTIEIPGLVLRFLDVKIDTAKFDLALGMVNTEEGLIGLLEYSTDLFEVATIRRMIGHFQTLLESIVANPEQQLSNLPLLTKLEQHQLLVEFSKSQFKIQAPYKQCVHELFADQVEKTPDAVAVEFVDKKVTYQELNCRANQLAHYLKSLGVGPDVLVSICVERSPQMLIAILGVLKAGGAYVPLDPVYPSDRLAFMLKDSQSPVLITQQRSQQRLPQHQATVVCLDSDCKTILEHSPENPINHATVNNLAYVIYTSGSTGVPKGVMIPHAALTNYIQAATQEYSFNGSDRVLQFASISFDAALEEIFPCLVQGGTLVLRTDAMLNSVPTFLQKCCELELTVLDLPTAFWHQVTSALATEGCLLPKQLRLLVIGGEKAFKSQLTNWRKYASKSIRLVNTYGPTETTIVATKYDLSESASSEVLIGSAIHNVETYVLDTNLQPVPIGIVGELHIGGTGLSKGYLHRPELTVKKFIPHPYSQEPSTKLYKTGDLVRYLSDGNIEFIGRIDHQVKIRGFRIELGEIETALCQYPDVRSAVVMPWQDASNYKRLVAYVVSHNESDAIEEQESAAKLQTQQLSEWQGVFDNLYSQVDSEQELNFYIQGWESSYTGQPIPNQEVSEWMEQTVEHISALRPKRVLELGCGGSGLMLLRIAPDCQQYCATDQSENALRILQYQLDQLKQPLPGVTLMHRTASDFTHVAANSFDAVLIVSVAQYFPSINYLLQVLENAVNAVEPGGFVFLGDIRSLPLLEAFHASVQFYRASDSLSPQELQQRVQKQLFEEKQLVIDPAFFTALKQYLPKISHVEILLERGHYHNELTKFRYDVILHVAGESHPSLNIPWLDWEKQELTLESVRQMLVETEPEFLGIAFVPNLRVAEDLQILAWLAEDQDGATVADMRKTLQTNAVVRGVDPEDFWAFSQQLPYVIAITWSTSATDGHYDVVFRHCTTVTTLTPLIQKTDSLRPWSDYANVPWQRTYAREMASNLRDFVKSKLPEYMVPATFILLDSLPLLPNGKVNLQALPAPDEQVRTKLEDTFVAPRNRIEAMLATIWAKVLAAEKVGINDNFFELGGDSILSLQVISKVNQVGLQLTTKQLFQHQTIAELAAVAGTSKQKLAEQGIVKGVVPLTPIQHWFFEQNLLDPNHWNQSILLEVRQTLNPFLLKQAVQHLLLHHDALRMRFVLEGDNRIQQINASPKESISFTQIDLSALPETEQISALKATANQLQASLNLSQGPLVQVGLFDLGKHQRSRLLIIIHHLVVDGISWRILLEDLHSVYEQLLQGVAKVQLPPKSTSFQQWAQLLVEYANSAKLQSELYYWLSQLQKPIVSLPVDDPGGDNTIASSCTVSASLSPEETQALLQEIPTAYQTQINDVLLTALAQTFAEWTGVTSLLVDLEGHGREVLFDEVDLSRTVGWFTSMFPVLLDIQQANSPIEALKIVKEQLRRLPNRGISYGILRYLSSDETAEKLANLPQAEVVFNYLGRFDQTMSELSLFSPAGESAGANYSKRGEQSHLIAVNGLIIEGQLQLNWTYSKAVHSLSAIESLAQKMILKLRSLIAYCQFPDMGGYTPSDFPDVELSQAQLDKALAEIDFG